LGGGAGSNSDAKEVMGTDSVFIHIIYWRGRGVYNELPTGKVVLMVVMVAVVNNPEALQVEQDNAGNYSREGNNGGDGSEFFKMMLVVVEEVLAGAGMHTSVTGKWRKW
jgi:hypothetical protein